MAIDWDAIAAAGGIPKSRPRVLAKVDKDRDEARAWAKCCEAVDTRDKFRCFVSGKPVRAGAVDAWGDLARAHLEFRSQSKARRFLAENVVTVSRGVHQLIDARALLLLDKADQPAKRFQDIDHVAWNRRMVAKNEEPFKVRKGLPVLELDKVKD